MKNTIEFPNASLQPNAEEALLCIHNFLDVLELIDDKHVIILSQETVLYEHFLNMKTAVLFTKKLAFNIA